jgi:hypothetical protein
VVAVPLAVVAGETAPHADAEHDTVHATPLFDGSLLTTAVRLIEAAACVVEVFGVTETVMGSWDSLPPLLLPPPQPAIAIVKTSPSDAKAENVDRFTTPPFGQPEWRAAIRTIALNDDA